MNAKAEQASRLLGSGLGHEEMLQSGRWTLDARLKKLRVVHVLDSYERRDEAKDYIW